MPAPTAGTPWNPAPTRNVTRSTSSRATSPSIWRRPRTGTGSTTSSWSRRPRSSGDLRELLPKTVHGKIVAEINKDLTKIPTRDLGKHLDPHLPH